MNQIHILESCCNMVITGYCVDITYISFTGTNKIFLIQNVCQFCTISVLEKIQKLIVYTFLCSLETHLNRVYSHPNINSNAESFISIRLARYSISKKRILSRFFGFHWGTSKKISMKYSIIKHFYNWKHMSTSNSTVAKIKAS